MAPRDGARPPAGPAGGKRDEPLIVVPGVPQMTMYTTSWCGFCRRLKTQLDREGIGYLEVDIEREPSAADTVTQVNGGNRTVPTVVYPDGTSATNPSFSQVKESLSRAEAAS